MTVVLVLLLTLWQPSGSFEKLPPDQRPTLEDVKTMLAVCAEGNTAFTLHMYSASYLTRWHPRVVIDIDVQPDDSGIPRVIRLKCRLRTVDDSFFYYRQNP